MACSAIVAQNDFFVDGARNKIYESTSEARINASIENIAKPIK